MKLVALLLAIALTAGVGYGSQAVMAADAGRFVRLTEGFDPAAVWFGGTLPPLVVTGRCETGQSMNRSAARSARVASSPRFGGTLPAIVVTARAPTVRHLATVCPTPTPAHLTGWHVD